MKKLWSCLLITCILLGLVACNSSANKITCQSCGEQNISDVKFCSNCGSAMYQTSSTDDASIATDESSNNSNDTSSNNDDNIDDDIVVDDNNDNVDIDCSSGHIPSSNGYCTYCGVNTVQYISNRSIQHDDDYFTFIFSLLDENECEIAVNATVDMRIENEDGEIVYQDTKKITTNDYSTWSNNWGKEWYAASLRIYDSEIEAGTTKNGTFIFEVTINDSCYFEEDTLSIYDELPKIDLTKQCTLTLPALPHSVSDTTNNDWLISKITKVDYFFEESYNNKVILNLSFSGERSDYDVDGTISKYCEISWKLVDEEGYVVYSGSTYSPALEPGEKFKNVTETVYELEAGAYTLILLGTVD